MIVKSFKAKDVYGYLDFDIKFNDDISFLVGGNGSGKTTALKLMNALVKPNFKDLIQTTYKSISLKIIDNNKREICISSRDDGENKSLEISSLDENLFFPSNSNVESDYYMQRPDKLDEHIDQINREYVNHEIIKQISEIESPVFLGLDRRRDASQINRREIYYENEEYFYNRPSKRSMSARRLIRGTLGESLMETEHLVLSSYKRLRDLEERLSKRLSDSILTSAFQYSDFDPAEIKIISPEDGQKLLARKNEISEAISKMGVKNTNLLTEIENFFDKITKLFNNLSKNNEKISMELLLNMAQIEKISKIVDTIDDHKSNVEKIYKPLNDFLETINNFFGESNKKLDVNTVGQLIVHRPNGSKCSIESLSSGEKQLVVIFAHAIFSNTKRNRQRKVAFIIDEPELSLHLGWQEKFAKTIHQISPSAQFILATHSPEIIGVNGHKAVGCR